MIFSQEFMRNALLAGTFVALACGVSGWFVVLRGQGPIRMAELAAHEWVRAPTITKAIRRLEKLGLVQRSGDACDRRAVLVDITPLGLAVLGAVLNRRTNYIPEFLYKLL